jgi:hypothetical protein
MGLTEGLKPFKRLLNIKAQNLHGSLIILPNALPVQSRMPLMLPFWRNMPQSGSVIIEPSNISAIEL